MYKMFVESLLNQADYEMLAMAQFSDYPLQLCTHCWVKHLNIATTSRYVGENC